MTRIAATNAANTNAANINAAPKAFSVNAAHVPLEGGMDPAFGSVRWRTLINGDDSTPKEFVLGVAEFDACGTLEPHRHSAAEFYFGLSGSGVVTIDGTPHDISAGVALYIPGDAEHGVVAGPEGLRFSYGFAEPQFSAVTYRFSAAANAPDTTPQYTPALAQAAE